MASEATTNVASPGAAAAVVPTPPPSAADPAARPVEGATSSAPAEAPKETPPKQEPDFGARFAALTKKERAVVERERALKAQEREFTEWKKAKEAARLDPLAFLESNGLTYDQVTQFVLNDRKLTEAQRLALLEERLQKEDASKVEAAKAAEQREIQETINGHKSAIGEFLSKGGDDFEVTLSHGDEGVELVYQVIEQRYRDTFDPETGRGEILPIDAAAKEVEAYLENLARERVLKLKKFQPKIEVKNEAATPTPTAPGVVPETKRPAPTLTNASVASTPPPESLKDLSDEESKRYAASLLRWR